MYGPNLGQIRRAKRKTKGGQNPAKTNFGIPKYSQKYPKEWPKSPEPCQKEATTDPK